MNRRNVAVFILTHGRSENVQTYKTLRSHGYTGKIYLVIDDEDEQEGQYRAIYGDEVVQFCKEEYLRKSLCINPDKPRKVVLYARNACFDIAKKLGITHFVEMDDDYSAFQWRYDDGERLRAKECKNLDRIIDLFFDFMEQSGAKSVAFGQGGGLAWWAAWCAVKIPYQKKSNEFVFLYHRKSDWIHREHQRRCQHVRNKGQQRTAVFQHTEHHPCSG